MARLKSSIWNSYPSWLPFALWIGCQADAACPDPSVSAAPAVPVSAAGTEPELPPALAAARSASIVVRFGDAGGCSATKVGERLVLTAAHCKVGYSGHEDKGPAYFERDGVWHPLSVVEMGAFEPATGAVQDWLLLEPVDADLESISVAPLASAVDMHRLRAAATDALDDSNAPIWAISHPATSYRAHPRTPMPGGQVASRGFLKSDLAYRTSIANAVSSHRIYDDRDPGPAPEPSEDLDRIWSSSEAAYSVREHYERYEAAGDPILYHSADYSNGSSGGGFFDESSGALIGIVPFGAGLLSRRSAYPGFGSMYGIDAICRESQTLRC
jgi:hypothetical protein